ncbi:MAG: hemolysin family protein [Oscillospiraceae bacterium]|nr:hemolysin family protein [Oscillospiraceae bacterium]
MAWQIAVIIILILLSGFFASSETAITGTNRIRIKHRAENGSVSAKKVLRLLENYDRMLATLLIGVNVLTIIVASVATLLAIDLARTADWDEGFVVAVSSAVLTVALIIFSDILPKTLAREHADWFVLTAAGVLTFVMWLFMPISSVMLLLQRGVTKIFAKEEAQVSVTEEELLQIIDEIEDEGVLEEHESDLVRSALVFDETTVEKIQTPRVDIVAVSINDSVEKVRDVFLKEGYSRLPVYEESLDKIVGMISNKEFMKRLLSTQSEKSAHSENTETTKNVELSENPEPPNLVRDLVQDDIIKLPALMKLSEALKLMQRQKSHLAVVLDQYGGTAGIVTLEDILEELVGEIWDEGDEETQPIKFKPDVDGVFEVQSELSIIDFNRFFADRADKAFKSDESEKSPQFIIKSERNTVGGWVFELFGKIPEAGEITVSELFKITVLTMEGRRIGRLRFELM